MPIVGRHATLQKLQGSTFSDFKADYTDPERVLKCIFSEMETNPTLHEMDCIRVFQQALYSVAKSTLDQSGAERPAP